MKNGRRLHRVMQWAAVFYSYMLLFQSAVVAAEREIMLHLSTQHKLGVFQGLVVEQPVQVLPAVPGCCRTRPR